jgi:2-hydroxychromene-2-carboxylate isomerase
MKIEYYYSVASPYAYLGISKFQEIVNKYSIEVDEKPFDLVGTVFPATGGTPVPKRHPSRKEYRLLEIDRAGKKLNLNINKQPKFFPPADPHKAALFAIATIQNGLNLDFGKAVLTKLWSEEQDISLDSTLEEICKNLNLDFSGIKKASEKDDIKQAYLLNSEEAIKKGVFGAPSFILENELFWGQDRLDFLEDKIKHLQK